MPPFGDLEQAFLRRDGRGEGAAPWPKSVDSSSSDGTAPVLTGTNGLSRRGELAWIALAMSSLPVPLSPWMQHGRAAGRNLRDEVEEPQHGSLLPTMFSKLVALLQGALELHDLFFGALPADRGADVGEQLLVVPRLLDEVLRARADGVDDVAYRPVRGDHDDRQIRAARPDARQQVDAALARKREVEQQQIVVVARVSRSMPAAPSPARSTEKPSSVSRVSSDSRMRGLVVDDEDASVSA